MTKEGRKRWMQWCHSGPLLFSTNAAERGWACIPLLQITHSHTHTFSHVTHTHHTTRRETLKAEQRYRDATGWQPLRKSTFPPLYSSFSLSVCCDCHSAARLSSFLSQTLLCQCEMASVFSDWETFQNFSLSMPCTYLTLLSLPFFSFLCMWEDTGANPGHICILAQSQTWMPLYLNNSIEHINVDLLFCFVFI